MVTEEKIYLIEKAIDATDSINLYAIWLEMKEELLRSPSHLKWLLEDRLGLLDKASENIPGSKKWNEAQGHIQPRVGLRRIINELRTGKGL